MPHPMPHPFLLHYHHLPFLPYIFPLSFLVFVVVRHLSSPLKMPPKSAKKKAPPRARKGARNAVAPVAVPVPVPADPPPPPPSQPQPQVDGPRRSTRGKAAVLDLERKWDVSSSFHFADCSSSLIAPPSTQVPSSRKRAPSSAAPLSKPKRVRSDTIAVSSSVRGKVLDPYLFAHHLCFMVVDHPPAAIPSDSDDDPIVTDFSDDAPAQHSAGDESSEDTDHSLKNAASNPQRSSAIERRFQAEVRIHILFIAYLICLFVFLS